MKLFTHDRILWLPELSTKMYTVCSARKTAFFICCFSYMYWTVLLIRLPGSRFVENFDFAGSFWMQLGPKVSWTFLFNVGGTPLDFSNCILLFGNQNPDWIVHNVKRASFIYKIILQMRINKRHLITRSFTKNKNTFVLSRKYQFITELKIFRLQVWNEDEPERKFSLFYYLFQKK